MITDSTRYMTTPPFYEGGVVIFCTRNRHIFPKKGAKYYSVKKGDTLDGISYLQYGDSKLWWAILDSNPQYMTEMDIEIGDVLMIPFYLEVVKVV